LTIGAAAQPVSQKANGESAPVGHAPAGHAEEAFSSFTSAAGSTASASDPCEQLAPGSPIATPKALYSSNGKLEVNFSFVTGTDSNGLTRYCYINPDTGDQAPTLRVNPGDQLIIHFTNDISTSSSAAKAAAAMPGMTMTPDATTVSDCAATTMTAVSTNLHFHGMNVSPACHQDEVIHTVIQPGQEFDYTVQIPANEPSGMYWYHPHPHGFSENQLLGGATGVIIVEGIQNFNSVVVGLPERILVLRDQPLQPGEAGKAGAPAHDLSLNDVPVTFPAYTPSVLEVPASTASAPVQEFWRVANTASDTLVDLQYVVNGVAQPVQVVAIDGVPLTDGSGNPATSSMTSLVLGTGARAEFIVTTPKAGQTAQLVAQGWNNGTLGSINLDYDPTRPLANIVASSSTTDGGLPTASLTPARIPAATRSSPPLRFNALNTATPTVTRNLYFSVNLNSNPAQFFITVAGQTPAIFNMNNPPSIVTRVGTVEQWTVQNQSPMDHAFHIHQIHFRTLAINGSPVTDYTERDTIDIPHWTGSGPYPSVTLLMDFTDPDIVGTFVYHCHILNHEDLGMMGAIQVLPALIDSTTALKATPSPATPGESVTLTATVAASTTGTAPTPTGTVSFSVGSTKLGTGTLNSAGIATLATTALPAGSDAITAAYSGDTNFAASTSSPLTVDVSVPPAITAVSPNYGAFAAVVTVTGSNFGATQGASTLTFNGTPATSTSFFTMSWSNTQIIAIVPQGATSGNLVVTVGGVASNPVAFSVYPAPVVTGISPTSGPVGTTVTITGTNLEDPEGKGSVQFNGIATPILSQSSTSLQVKIPAGATTGTFRVHASGAGYTSPTFTVTTPTIAAVSPNYGAFAAVVTVTGSNFGATQGSSALTFNGTPAASTSFFTMSWSNTQIVAIVPQGATSGNLVVTVGGVASNPVAFSVYPAPVVTGISPTSGPVGTTVTITGTNLEDPEGKGSVQFNGIATPILSQSSTSLQVKIPAGGTTGTFRVHASGAGYTSPTFTVTATPAPVISNLSHNYGAPGAVDTITGSNFGAGQGTSTVSFNGTVAAPTAWSASSITVPVPAGATTGNIVVNVGGQASNGVPFSIYPDPSITGISPSSGPVGTVVTVTGVNLKDPENLGLVQFNGITVKPATLTNTSVQFAIPSGATTGKVLIYSSGVPVTSAVFTVN
jgi:FtsP/CotA-like multicopper oxidase with cupredoxin domain